MRKHLAALATELVQIEPLWKILRRFVRVFWQLGCKRERVEAQRLIESSPAASLKACQTVLNGPFAGMHYPTGEAVMSAFYPKIIGCYEGELHEALDSLQNRDYRLILDIGCAEGYYAVGLARRYPDSLVHGYDINPRALELTLKMACANGVEDRVQLRSRCTWRELAEQDFRETSLIFCDCEGFEDELFDPRAIPNLRLCDLIIEVHDHLRPGLSSRLVERFEETHEVERVSTYDTLQKLYKYHYPETEGLSHEVRTALFREWRYTYQEWLVLRAKDPT